MCTCLAAELGDRRSGSIVEAGFGTVEIDDLLENAPAGRIG